MIVYVLMKKIDLGGDVVAIYTTEAAAMKRRVVEEGLLRARKLEPTHDSFYIYEEAVLEE